LPRSAKLSDIDQTARYTNATPEDLTIYKEITKAIRQTKSDKASGISEITNRVLQADLVKLLPSLQRLFNAYIKLGYHPRQFKNARTIILKKSNKGNYTDPKAYRPIALLNTIGKILESILAKKISDIAERQELLSNI